MPSRCLVTSFDRKYYKYAAVMLQSLAQNYKKPLDVVCIVTPDLLEDDTLDRIKTRLVGADHLNIIFRASNNQEAKDAKPWFEITNYISGIIIDKVSIGEICHDYDEAVYVDGDCLFVRDATKFVNHPLHAGAKIIAMPEQSMVAERDLGKPEMAYFNNGVFVTDLSYWRKNNLQEKMINWMLTENTGACPEQTAMNIFLHDVWFPLSPNFNYWDSFSWPNLTMAYPHPVIIHFLGPIKPWNFKEDNTVIRRGPHDKLWKYIYSQLWGIDTLYSSTSEG
jgi:lipopolysaccharide biosynthesis glycosyltransferase